MCALVTTGCSVLNASVPTPLSAFPAPAGVPTAEQTNVSPYPLAQRLGKWNGTTFTPVTPDSIAAGNVMVMTHGWAAGLLATYEAAQATSADLVTMWNPAMVDPKTNQAAITLFANLATSLQSADPSATVLMYSWVDQSSTDTSALAASAPERATEVNGHRMATAIDQTLAAGFSNNGGQIHLIGHSFGANVATTAALALATPPRQLTLFDSPEVNLARIGGAKNDLRYKLTRLDIGRSPNQTFVDNYISLVGEPYAGYPGLGQVVDVHLKPPSSDAGVDKHQYPIGWYANSASTKSSGVGLWWSPMMGASDVALATTWNQTSSDPSEELVLVAQGVAPSPTYNSSVSYLSTAIADQATGPSVATTRDTVSNTVFTTDKDSLWLTFDTTIAGAPTDTFHLFIDGRLRSTFAPPAEGTGSDGSFLILYDIGSGTHTLSLVVEGPTNGSAASPTASASLTNLRISSTTDIQRNLTPTQSKELIIWAVALVILVIVVLSALLILLVIWIVKKVRRNSSSHE
jgi:pimeloyl-ACP methyl ester carboxylesterase